MKPTSTGNLLLGLVGLAAALMPLPARAASLLYQWNFNGATGTPNVGAGGGTLVANGSASFAAIGVSGTAGDNALSVTNSYTGGSGSGNSSSAAGGNVLTGIGTLNSFTLTMWVNLAAGSFSNFGRLFEIGTVGNPDNTSPGIYLSMNNGNLQYGMNALTVTQTVPLLNVSAAGTWVFVAVSYDGVSPTSFSSSPNSAAYGTFNNTVVLTGSTTTSVAVSNSAGINFTGTTAGPVALGAAATAFLGNRSDGGRGLTGSLDDVRLYSGQLTVPELEGVRLETVPEPATPCLLLLGSLGLIRRRRSVQPAAN